MRKPAENQEIAKVLQQTSADLRREAEAVLQQSRDLQAKIERRWKIARPRNGEERRKDSSSQN